MVLNLQIMQQLGDFQSKDSTYKQTVSFFFLISNQKCQDLHQEIIILIQEVKFYYQYSSHKQNFILTSLLTHTIQSLRNDVLRGRACGIFQCALFSNNKVELTGIYVSVSLRIKTKLKVLFKVNNVKVKQNTLLPTFLYLHSNTMTLENK